MSVRFVCGLLTAAALAWAGPALAWGPEGHTVIARVGTATLKPAAAADLTWILTVGVPALNAQISQKYGMKCQIDVADPWGPVPDYRIDKDQHTNLASWADCYRFLDRTTGGWHFNDIPLGETPTGPLNAEAQPWCVQPKICGSLALADTLRKLAAPGQSPADAAMTLALVVHILGDLHQPLHEEDNGDQGGNTVLLMTDGSGVVSAKLHDLWDVQLVEAALTDNPDAGAKTLARLAASVPAPTFSGVDAVIAASDGWVEDAHRLAQAAYAALDVPVGAGARSGVVVTKAYVDQQIPVVDSQLALAARRLQAALDATLTWPVPK
jgi:hypothetical protein